MPEAGPVTRCFVRTGDDVGEAAVEDEDGEDSDDLVFLLMHLF